MKSKKKYVIFGFVVIIYLLIIFFFYVKNSKDVLYIVVGDNTIWSYSKKKWTNITEPKQKDKLNWTKFMIYADGKKVGKYNLWFDEQWYAFNDNNKAILYDGQIFAYQSPRKIKSRGFKSKDIKDYSYVEAVLKKSNINIDGKYQISKVITIDFDSDGKKEDLYLVSNAFIENEVNDYYTFVFMVKDNTVYKIYSKTNIKDIYKGCLPNIDGFIDINNDDKYEIVFTCSKYSIQKPIDRIYQFKNDKFEKIVSN